MASASTPLHHRNMANLQRSRFHQTVCLADWWLVKAENDVQGRRLAVAGFTSRENQAMRLFSSAPILKRYDVLTVETSDGICVILNGFMNKARTIENGFPVDVCDHFIIGFPPYWKEYDEKFMGDETPSKDISGVNLLKKLSPQSGTGEQPHRESHEKDFGSQGIMNGISMQKSKRTKSSAVPLSTDSGNVIGVSEEKPWIASEGFEKESHSGGPNSEGHSTLELPLNCLKNKIKSVSDSSCGESINVSAVTHQVVNYSQNCDSGGILSACHLNRSRKRVNDNSRKVESDENNSTKVNFDIDIISSEETLSRNEVRVSTRSTSSLKMKEKNNETSPRKLGGAKLNSASLTGSGKLELALVIHKPGSRNNLNFEVSGRDRPTDKIQLGLLDAGPVEHGFEQVPETPDQNEGMRKMKSENNIKKMKNKSRSPCTPAAATKSLCTPAAADNQTENVIAGKNSLSEKANASDKGTRRKLAYVSKETPDREKEKVPSGSQSLSFNRSRSGRLLMPMLEFWRNQRAIYNSDRIVTGIEEGIHPEPPRSGSKSTARKKRKQ